MQIQMIVRLVMLFVCYLFSGGLWAYDISNVSEPPESNTVFVGNVVQNGVPLQMKEFSSSLTPSEVLAYYRVNWSDPRKVRDNVVPFIEEKAGIWKIISQRKDLYNIVVQVKHGQNGGSEGFISVLNLTNPPGINKQVKKFPRIGGTQLVSSTESLDGGKHAITLVLMNDYSVDSNDAFYRSKMEQEGWVLAQGDIRDSTVTLLFNKPDQQCEMAIARADKGNTIIIANVTKKGK